jgi:hypothetical protein
MGVIKIMEDRLVCPKCKGAGRIVDSDGTVHTCFDCLIAGRLDMHSKDIKDSGIRL